MKANTRKHLIAASNFLMGATNFLIVPLPKSWNVGRGFSPPEVDANTHWGEVSWVTSGRASQVLFNEDEGVALEFVVKVSRGKKDLKPKMSQVRAQGPVQLGGHEATYALGEMKRGFPRRKIAQVLQASFYCDKTKRTINLEFVGQCAEGDLEALLEAISWLECH
ncbi:MAG: hypothetical protein ACE5MB_04835 [Anaerolineae bacterium]